MESRELPVGVRQQKILLELPSEWLPEIRDPEIRRRRKPTVTGVRICMYPDESTGNREEEWYRAGFLLVFR